MEMSSFGEDLVVKARKPYTITKQREKWTEEEHGRFLEALKLYGRAWQRIEEHIGTKTAIQIRSHAQKFFTKLEKEAVATGIPLGRVHDIDIPPPRPKKKPNYPYPRKIGSCSAPSPIEAADEKTLKTMNPIPQEINKQEAQSSVVAKSPHQAKEYCDDARCSVVLNLFQEAPSASIPSRDKASKSQLSFREYVPTATPSKEPPSLRRSSLTIEVNMESTSNGMPESDLELRRTSVINMELHALSASSGDGETSDAPKQPKTQSETNREAKGMHKKCVDGCNLKTALENGYSSSSANPLMNHTIPAAPAFHSCSAMSYISHPFPTFPSPAQLQTTHDFYRSLLGISSTFSREIVSALLRYPGGNAAACMSAASHWHSEEMDSSKVEAIAAATVAAASAWWTTNGLIPFFPPINASGFAFPPPPTTSFPVMNTDQAPQEKQEQHETYQNSTLDQTALVSSSSLTSSSNMEENEKNISNFNNFKPLADTAYHNPDRAKINKHERSSCGSNTTSSSEIERFATLKKNGETKDATILAQTENLQDGEVYARRVRSSSCSNETWKEVSQEGRIAFQALFTRDILPQSFATQLHKLKSGLHEEDMGRNGRDETTQNHHSLPIETRHGNLKVRRTGFKPYKRCSAEAAVNNNYSANDETNNKKIRVE